MHPAPSIILFTSLSGLGFGLMVWLGMGLGPTDSWAAGLLGLLALVLAGAGLVCSMWHLGNPQRALRALTQWRSSWLSREGVAAVATMTLFTLFVLLGALSGEPPRWLGILAAVLALVTVASTAMIYRQMRTVPRWHDPAVLALFLLYALGGGALLAGRPVAALVLLVVLCAVQFHSWRKGDGAMAASGSSPETATGLAALGTVRLLEPPHTSPNYVMKEMVGTVGRDRADALRKIAMGLGMVLPALSMLVALFAGVSLILVVIAATSHLVGVIASRWLFFAEAEHVVGHYYGAR